MTCCLITGASGFAGSHLAETCLARGWQVRGLVRTGSDASFLEHIGVAVFRGDLQQPDSLPQALEGVDIVFHAAAKVGDWGPIDEYRRVNVEGLRALLEACKSRKLQRFVHFSSLGVYAARDHHGTDESQPLPQRHIDGYTQSKVEAERLALEYQIKAEMPIVVIRPGFIYGPRDRTIIPKVVANLRAGLVRYLGSGEQALNTIFVRNLADAAILAATTEGVIGRVYNLTDGERVSKRQFLQTIADGMGVPRPRHSVPLWFARFGASVLEGWARAIGSKEAPVLTQARLKFLGLNLDFSIERAKKELGYAPKTSFAQGMAQTLQWCRENNV